MFNQMSQLNLSRRNLLRGSAGLGAGALAGSLFGRQAFAAAPPKFKTVEEGFITIAMSGSMPVTGMKDDKIIGSDAEMIVAIAKHLGLGVKPNLMAWSATIEAIKTGRADIMCGDMGWSKARSNAMLLTDAIYYDSNYVTMKKDKPFTDYIDVNDMSGHSVGSGTGYSYVPDLKKIPGVTEVKLYDTDDACLRDVEAGRLDFAVLDGMSVDYMLLQNPGIELKLVAIKPNTQYAGLTGKGQAVMGMNFENTDLFDAVNDGVKWLWKSKTNAECLARNGMKDVDYMIPMQTNPRIGVDRSPAGEILGPAAHTPKDFSALFA
ncbi:amino acid ABC transporter substrate-binding protein [Agrobacterium rhizogenes]|nr:amino acid ABC transporter substrate-binding protein [Rhizobium rhizogenes]NTH62058.1 amino acid ABC transporter substrate-binding protein [Rhizobium rhizogenes]NTH93684.1 amino acid ABC transporter substrate-binding protein [Rhizobium rhizogenes]